MLFRKNMDPNCSYCKFSAHAEPGTVICKKKGIMPENGSCRKFRYNPLQRTPPKPANIDFTKYDSIDFSL